MAASENHDLTTLEVGDRVMVIGRQTDRIRSCWRATPNLTEVLLDPEWTSPPPPSAPLPPRQRLVITAAVGSPEWVPLDSPGPWFLAEFSVAQTTWQTVVTTDDVERHE